MTQDPPSCLQTEEAAQAERQDHSEGGWAGRKAEPLSPVFTLSCLHEAWSISFCHRLQPILCRFCLQNGPRRRPTTAPARVPATFTAHLDYGAPSPPASLPSLPGLRSHPCFGLGDLTLGLHTTKMQTTPQFILPAQTSPLNARLPCPPACSASPVGCSTRPHSQLFSLPHRVNGTPSFCSD